MIWRDRSGDAGDDIDFFLAEETDANIARGMSPEEARRAARLKFGNVLRFREEMRAVWVRRWLDDALCDVRYAWRISARAKSFTGIILLLTGLGVGVNTAVFSLVDALLLRPLPYPSPGRLVAYSDEGKPARFKSGISAADFAIWQERARSFDSLAGYQSRDATVSTGDIAMTAPSISHTGELWHMTGARPQWGRLATGDAAQAEVVISHRLFVKLLGGNPSAVGKPILLDGTQAAVSGVLPPSFQFLLPHGASGLALREPDIYQSAGPIPSGDRRRFSVAGRLREGWRPEAALVELKELQAFIQKDSPDRWFAGLSWMQLRPLRESLTVGAAEALAILQLAGLLVLLIVCANVAGLLLARGLARRKELAIRASIGAGSGRLLRQCLCEGLFLSAAGGALGLLLSGGLLVAMRRWGAETLPRLAEVRMNENVLLFAVGLSLFTAMAFSLWPFLIQGRADLSASLRGAGTAEHAASRMVRATLTAGEFALAVVLVVGAGLMVRSFAALMAQIPGFTPERILTLRVSLAGADYNDKARAEAVVAEMETALQTLPGVVSAGVVERQSYLLQSASPANPNVVDRFDDSLVTPGYFGALGMRLVRGRWLTAGDAREATVVNETLARRVFGQADPIGQEVRLFGRPVRVVGVAADLQYAQRDQPTGPELFRGYTGNLAGRPVLQVILRTSGDPEMLIGPVKALLAVVAPAQAVHDIRTLEAELAGSIAPRRLHFALLLGFAVISLALATVGAYGMAAYSVTQRTREIAIRRALGAGSVEIWGSVLRLCLWPASLGILAGLGGAAVFARWMRTLLYGVEPLDGATFVAVPVLLFGAAIAACVFPAAKAVNVDPIATLRMD